MSRYRTTRAEAVSPVDDGLLADIEAAADIAYLKTAIEFPHYRPADLHRRGVCVTASKYMAESLIKNFGREAGVIVGRPLVEGIDAEADEHARRVVARVRDLFHHYPVVKSAEGILYADPTWQQMVSRKDHTPDLPDVLVGRPRDFLDYLASPRDATGQPLIDNPFTLGFWMPGYSRETAAPDR